MVSGGFLEDHDVLVDSVDSEHRWVSQRPQAVVLGSSVPDDDVVQSESYVLHKKGQVHVEGEEVALLSEIHYDYAAVASGFEDGEDLGENVGEGS